LVNSYQLQERRRKELGKRIRKHPGHPVLPILPGHDQPDPHQRRCFGCGELGHLKGDPAYKAGPDDVWKGAPPLWKARRGADGKRKRVGKGKDKGKGGGKGIGKGKGQPYQRNLGDRKPAEGSGEKKDGICHNWSRGNGYCKYGPNCNYKHEGPQGGKKRNADVASLLTSGGTKKSRKKLVTLLMKDLQESMKGIDRGEKHGRDDEHEDEDAHVYKLIRGAPTVMFTQRGDDSQEYRPKWEDDLEGDSDGEKVKPVTRGQRQSKRRNVRFSVTLMATPKRESKPALQSKTRGDKPVLAPRYNGSTSNRDGPNAWARRLNWVPRVQGPSEAQGPGVGPEKPIYSEEEEDSDEEGKPVSAPGAESPRRTSTPSPPSLEHFRGGFQLPKRVPKKLEKDDCPIGKEKNVPNLNWNSMAFPEGSRESSSHPSGPMSRGGTRTSAIKGAKRERPSDRRKSRQIKALNAKSSLEGYPPLPETMEEFRRNKNLYVLRPMWNLMSPEEYFEWVKGVVWSEAQHERYSERHKHESSSAKGKGKVPHRTAKAIEVTSDDEFFVDLDKRDEKIEAKPRAQAKEWAKRGKKEKVGGTKCPPNRDDDILMVVKIKGRVTKLAYVDYINLDLGWGGPYPLDTTLGELLEMRLRSTRERQAMELDESVEI
jgi:hypothetical protein